MSLHRFIKPLEYKSVIFHLCELLKLLAIIFTIPLIVSLLSAEFIYSIIFAGLSAATFLLSLAGRYFKSEDLSKKEGLIITALAYLLFALISAFAFLPVTNYMNGLFESISGFTTTGLSVLYLDNLPVTLVFFRAYSQWIGGAGIIILTLVILTSPGTSAFKLYSSEFGQENLVGDTKNTGIVVLKIYSALTFVGFILYWISGVKVFDALLYILSTISTGGFTPISSDASNFNMSVFHIIVIIFMILGANSFSSIYRIRKNGIKSFTDNLELKYLIGIIILFSFLFFTAWNFNTDKILSSVFQSTTAITTTGFTIENISHLPPQIKLMNIFLMITGGASASTAGGIKIIRLILMFQMMRWMLFKLLLPKEAKISVKSKSHNFSDMEIKRVFSFFSLYILFLFISSLIFVFYNYGIIDSVFECSSALGTVGLSTGITSPELPGILKIVLILNMWAGRLEIFPLIALIYPKLWIPSLNIPQTLDTREEKVK